MYIYLLSWRQNSYSCVVASGFLLLPGGTLFKCSQLVVNNYESLSASCVFVRIMWRNYVRVLSGRDWDAIVYSPVSVR